MGVGKGSFARELLKHCDRFALDTDDLIESMENRKIKQIFKDDGERYFRDLEKKCAKWLHKSVDDAIISTGGGFYAVDGLEKIGKVVYLEADFDWIYERVVRAKNAKKKLKKRPLFNSYDKTKSLFLKRQKEYEKKADIAVDITSSDKSSIIKEILR